MTETMQAVEDQTAKMAKADGWSSMLGTISSTSPHELLWTPDRVKLFGSRRG